MKRPGQDREPQTSPVEELSAVSLNRRDFLIRSAALGLTGSALVAFLQACGTSTPPLVAPPTATATPPGPVLPQPTATATPVATPSPTLQPTPTIAAPTPTPTSTQTPAPPTPTPTSTLTPVPLLFPYISGNEEQVRLGHLLRRAGFGASAQEMEEYRKLGLDGTIDYLIEYQKVDDSALEERLQSLELDLEERPRDLQQWWLLRMVYTRRPLRERMTLFWHGILTSSSRKVGKGPWMLQQNQLLRTRALGTYDVLLKAISRDPAMLIWLDSRRNRKDAPNENYARELMELFSMGVGTFSELDVREAARAFTGWFIGRDGFVFRSQQHDFGVKNFLGRSGDFDGDDIVNIILEQPATAQYIARRLFTSFVHDDPDPGSIEPLAEIFRWQGYDIRAMMRHILTSEEFYSPRAYRAKIKSPAELVAGAIRTLGAETTARQLPGVTGWMGQELFNPPDVAGWPGGISWINSTTLLQRANLANLLTNPGRNRNLDTRPAFAYAERPSPQQAVEGYLALLLDGQMPIEEQEVLQAYLRALGVTDPSDGLSDSVLRSLVYLLLASPDYQVA